MTIASPASKPPRRVIPRPVAPTGPLAELHREIRTCTACPLHKTRQHACPGEGPERAAVMCIGEGPGWDEDRYGRPFVGKAGGLLTDLMEQAGIPRSRVYLGNTVRCRPPKVNGSPKPSDDVVAACRHFLDREIALVRPAILVPVGATALSTFPGLFGSSTISEIHGQVHFDGERWVYPVYHPSYLLHQANNPVLRHEFEEDFKGLVQLMRVHAATLRHPWSLEIVGRLYKQTSVAHTPSAQSGTTTWRVLDSFALPQVDGATITWDITGIHSMFHTSTAIQELLHRWVGRPVSLEKWSWRYGATATIADDMTA